MSLKIADVYATINIADLPLIDFSQIGETNKNTIRKSIDLSEFVIKWNTEPSFIADGTIVPVATLIHELCLELMQTPEWSEPIPEL